MSDDFPRTGWKGGWNKPTQWPSRESWDATTEVINKTASRLRWKACLRWCSLLTAYISAGFVIGYLVSKYLISC